MDSKILIDTIYKSLSKTLTDVSIEMIAQDGNLYGFKVISPSFSGKTESVRSDLVHEILQSEFPKALVDFDITFVLLTKIENATFTDYNKINENSEYSQDKFAASEI